MTVDLADGRTLIVPLNQIPGFDRLPQRALLGYRLVGGGIGIYFPAIDEEVGVENLLHPELVLRPHNVPRLVTRRSAHRKRASA